MVAWLSRGVMARFALLLLLSACAAGTGATAFRTAADAEVARRQELYTNGEARAWQVRKDGAVRGLLWGTVHVGYDDSTVLPAPIRARFYDAADLTVEVVLDRVPAALRALGADIRRADAAYDAAAIERLDAPTRRALAGVPGTDGHDLSLRGLAARVSAESRRAGSDLTLLPTVGFVDRNLIAFARQQNRPVYGLERPELVDATIEDPNGPEAADALKRALRLGATSRDLSRQVLAFYRDGDVAGAMALLTAWQADADDLRHSDRTRERLLTLRNAAWLPRLDRRFSQPGEHFVAVGAAHLLGTDGLVALLLQRGYEVTPCIRDACR